jgi:curved DNA-binding protein CbpA
MDIEDYYRVLDLQPGATLEQTRIAYRDMVRIWHPDNFTNNPRIQKKAEEN